MSFCQVYIFEVLLSKLPLVDLLPEESLRSQAVFAHTLKDVSDGAKRALMSTICKSSMFASGWEATIETR